MTSGPRRRLVVRLGRSNRALWSWVGRFLRIAAVCLCVLIIGRRSDIEHIARSAECASAVRAKRPDAVQVCRFEYQRTNKPAAGALLAEALYDIKDLDAAMQVAAGLLYTEARSDALYLLGSIARREGRNEDALVALQAARALHRLEQRAYQLAQDDAVLALVRGDRSDFAEALRLIDECLTEAQVADDTDLQCRCHLSAAKVLIHAGYVPAALRELAISEPLASSEQRRSDVAYQTASSAQEFGDHALAIAKFRSALRMHPPDTLWTVTTELNLAYSLAEHGEIDEAQQHLDNAQLLDVKVQKKKERTWVAAQIAYRQHDLARAATLTDAYLALRGADSSDDPEDLDDRIDVEILRARIELERNRLEDAATWAGHGVDHAERIRRKQSVLELRPWVLAKWRTAHELQFTALVRSQHNEDAAMAFDDWQGRTVQDSLATPRPPESLGYRGMAAQLTKLGEWLSTASQAAFASRPNRQAVLDTMQHTDLVALIVAEGDVTEGDAMDGEVAGGNVAKGDVWRLVADHGPPRLSKIKPLREIQGLVDQFRGHPTDPTLASELGALLLPEEVFRTTRDVLHVVIDGRLPGFPVAALRRGGAPLIAMRPIVRLLRLPEARCARVARSGHATVLGVSAQGIPRAAEEAQQVAELLHATSQTGAAATRSALFAAAGDAVLHVAAHSQPGIDGAALALHDGEASGLEIRSKRIAPSLAVLTACGSATAADPELAGSLAAGFLAAGSQHVVATLGAISDAGGLEIATRFYRAGGVADPPRALAAVQAELAQTVDTDWPQFVVFGPEVCADTSLDYR